MSRAVRFLPLLILLLFVAVVSWRLIVPNDEKIRSRMTGQPVPAFVLAPCGRGRSRIVVQGIWRPANRAWSMSLPAGACRASPRRRC